MAAGEITAQDAARAKAELDHATKNLQIADAAKSFSEGSPLEEVSRSLVDRHGLSGTDLQDVIKRGRDVVAKNSFTPEFNPYMDPNDFRKLRQLLDKDIDWSLPENQGLKVALKGPRGQMKEALIASAPEAERGAYTQAMGAMKNRLGLREEIAKMIGKSDDVRRDVRSTNFLKAAAKEPAGGPRRALLERFAKASGKNFLSEADLRKLALEFGDQGRPSWTPQLSPLQLTEAAAAAGLGHYTGHPVLGAMLGAGAVAGSSPALATRTLIPAARIPPYLLRAVTQGAPTLTRSYESIPPYLLRKE